MAIARQFHDKPRQLLGCFAAVERRQPDRLFPRIETETCEGGNDAQRDPFDLLADACKQEITEIGMQQVDTPTKHVRALTMANGCLRPVHRPLVSAPAFS